MPGTASTTPRLEGNGQKLELGFDGKRKVWDASLDEFFHLKPVVTLDYGTLLTDRFAAGAAVHRDSTHSDLWFNGVFAPVRDLRLRVAGGQLRTGADTVAGDAYSGTIEQNSYLFDAHHYWHDSLLSNVGVTAYAVQANTGEEPASDAASGGEIVPGRQQGSALNLSLQPLPGSQVELWRESREQSYYGTDNQDPQTLVSHRFSFSQQLDNCMQVRGGYSSDDTQNQLDLQLARNRWSVSMSRVQAGSSNDMRFGIGYRLPLGGRTHDQESCRSAPAPAAAPSSIDQFPQSPLTMVVSD